VVGPHHSGKSTLLQEVALQLTKQEVKLLNINPKVFSSFRELYGVQDPFSISAQV
jgi:hypothetical protein